MTVHETAMRDPVFRAKRRRWITQWRRARPDRRHVEAWCMGHPVTGTVLCVRADGGGGICLDLDGIGIQLLPGDPNFDAARRLHERAMRNHGRAAR